MSFRVSSAATSLPSRPPHDIPPPDRHDLLHLMAVLIDMIAVGVIMPVLPVERGHRLDGSGAGDRLDTARGPHGIPEAASIW